MAFKFTKDETKSRDELLTSARETHEALDVAITKYNEAVALAFESVREACNDHCDNLGKLRDWLEETKGRLDEEFSDKSERWQESDRGGEVSQWIESFGNVDIEDVTIDDPEAIEVPSDDILSEIEDLQSSAEG